MDLKHCRSLAKQVVDEEVRTAQLLASPSARNVIVAVFWDCEGVILLDVMQRGTAFNSEAYIRLLNKNE
jgi:hypothetical protein